MPSWKAPSAGQDCHAVFTTDPTGYFPEMFSRVDGTVWLGGLNSATLPLPPARNGKAVPILEDKEKLRVTAQALYGFQPDSQDVEVLREALCFRPVTPRAVPMIGKVPDQLLGDGLKTGRGGGVFVVSGHGPWGITLCLGTGLVASELIEGKKTSANIARLGLKLTERQAEMVRAKL